MKRSAQIRCSLSSASGFALLVLLSANLLLTSTGCDSGDRMDQLRTAIAAAVSDLLAPLGPAGDLLGDLLALLITAANTPDTG